MVGFFFVLRLVLLIPKLRVIMFSGFGYIDSNLTSG
jgi:hypothetical protein